MWGLERCGCLRDCFAPARGVDFAGGKQGGICDGVRVVDRRDYLDVGTWYLGLPASSSHTLVGPIIGVGLANQLMQGHSGTSGVDWGQAANIGKSLLVSPIVGFLGAALLLLLFKALIPSKQLYEAPKGTEPPSILDSRHADPDMHRSELCSRLE